MSYPLPGRRFGRLAPPLLCLLLAGCAATEAPRTNAAAGEGSMAVVANGRAELAGRRLFAVINGEEAPVPDIPMGDPQVVARIIEEGTKRNRVMEHLTFLCNNIGPRLTGSSAAEAANKWARDRFEAFGLTNAHLDEWGTIAARFDRGPSTGAVYVRGERRVTDDDGAEQVVPEYEKVRDLQFTTLAWAPGTDGPERGPVFRMPRTLEELEAIEDRLEGAWILIPTDYSSTVGIRGVGGQMRARHKYWAELREKMAAGNNAEVADADDEASPAPDAAPAASADAPLAGRWLGMARGGPLGDDGLPLELVVTQDASGTPEGHLTVMNSRQPLQSPAFDKQAGTLTFTRQTGYGQFSYTLKLEGDRLTGAATGAETTLALDLSRAPVVPDEPSTDDQIAQRVLAAGVRGFISSSRDERVWTTSVEGWRELDAHDVPEDFEVCVRESDYDFINSRIVDGAPIEVEFDLPHTFTPGPIPVYNTIAEIPGTVWPDEVVIVSAHLDSWNGPGSQGTTDNGTGSCVTLEAARLLMAAGAQPKRTIRFILWTGEEQGLLGSRSYVERLGDDLAKVSACFVDDGGTNYQGGLQCIESMAPMLAAATAPINGVFIDPSNGEPMNVNVQVNERMPRGGGSDHASFNARGVPGFFWDEVGRAEYRYGWHTQNDRLDLAIPEYLEQSATCTAVTAYNLACAPTLLPRQEPTSDEEREAARERRRQRREQEKRQDAPAPAPAAPETVGAGR